jgi:hypothetical protein
MFHISLLIIILFLFENFDIALAFAFLTSSQFYVNFSDIDVFISLAFRAEGHWE